MRVNDVEQTNLTILRTSSMVCTLFWNSILTLLEHCRIVFQFCFVKNEFTTIVINPFVN